jgi:integrase
MDRLVSQHFAMNSISPKRRKLVLRVIGEFEAFIDSPLHELSDRDFRAWMASRMASGAHVNTVLRDAKIIRMAVRWAWRDDLLDSDVLMRIRDTPNPRGSTSQSQPNPYSRHELDKMWAKIDKAYPKGFGERYFQFQRRTPEHTYKTVRRASYKRVWRHAMSLQIEAIVLLALHGGMRQGEIFRATLDDLSPENAYVVVRGAAKGAGSMEVRMREVPMTQEMRRALYEWLAFRKRLKPDHEQPWLVLDPHASPNMVLAPSSPFNAMSPDRMGEILGKMGVSLQRLRHTSATNYLRAGMELERVSRLLGHASINQTLCYTKLVRDDVHASAQRVESKFTNATARRQEEAA